MRIWSVVILMMALSTPGFAQGCMAPVVPFMPANPADIRTYADILRADFETYFADAQAYFHCLEQERSRAFVEAQEVTAAYARMLEVLRE